MSIDGADQCSLDPTPDLHRGPAFPMPGGAMTTTRPETVRVTDTTPPETVAEVIEARTRRLMAERSRIACWGHGRKYRAEMLPGLDDSLDQYNQLMLGR